MKIIRKLKFSPPPQCPKVRSQMMGGSRGVKIQGKKQREKSLYKKGTEHPVSVIIRHTDALPKKVNRIWVTSTVLETYAIDPACLKYYY